MSYLGLCIYIIFFNIKCFSNALLYIMYYVATGDTWFAVSSQF